MISSAHELPEWLIDDTSGLPRRRVFVVHLCLPRFTGELVGEDELTAEDRRELSIAAPFGQVLCRIDWFDSLQILTAEEARCLQSRWPVTLAEAIRRHEAVRGPSR